MQIVIAAVGRLKDGPERLLYTRYAERVNVAGRGIGLGPIELREVPEGKASGRNPRMNDEAERLLGRTPPPCWRILLDERGKGMTSQAFAGMLRDLRDRGEGTMAFLIGGADGHGEPACQQARQAISLGPMTLPHGLARIVLAEQIYRAVTILSGHPYHRD